LTTLNRLGRAFLASSSAKARRSTIDHSAPARLGFRELAGLKEMMSLAMFGPGVLAHFFVAEDEPAVAILDDMESVEVPFVEMAHGQEFRLGLYDLKLMRHPAPRFPVIDCGPSVLIACGRLTLGWRLGLALFDRLFHWFLHLLLHSRLCRRSWSCRLSTGSGRRRSRRGRGLGQYGHGEKGRGHEGEGKLL
jgi:hypothetical protein